MFQRTLHATATTGSSNFRKSTFKKYLSYVPFVSPFKLPFTTWLFNKERNNKRKECVVKQQGQTRKQYRESWIFETIHTCIRVRIQLDCRVCETNSRRFQFSLSWTSRHDGTVRLFPRHRPPCCFLPTWTIATSRGGNSRQRAIYVFNCDFNCILAIRLLIFFFYFHYLMSYLPFVWVIIYLELNITIYSWCPLWHIIFITQKEEFSLFKIASTTHMGYYRLGVEYYNLFWRLDQWFPIFFEPCLI